MKIAYFTAGTVGAGHTLRGLAIRRGLLRQGFGGEIRAFGPEVPFPAARQALDREVVTIEGDRTYQNRLLAPVSPLAQGLRAYAPDLLLVDLFWAPLYWILPTLSCPAWLLLRLAPPIWLEGPPGVPFRPEPFERIIAIEPLCRAHGVRPVPAFDRRPGAPPARLPVDPERERGRPAGALDLGGLGRASSDQQRGSDQQPMPNGHSESHWHGEQSAQQ